MSDKEVFSAADDPLRYRTPSERARFTRAMGRETLESLRGQLGFTFRKRARLIALRMEAPFEVETDQGLISGKAGDWLAMNHPDDDPGSDVWVVSAERMAATYEPVA